MHATIDARRRAGRALLLAVLFGSAAWPLAPALAQTASKPPAPARPSRPADGDEAEDVSAVVVTGQRRPQPGAVVGDIKPELQLSPSDIQSYGVSTVDELLDELAPETRSDRGRGGEAPVVLLNGRRISGLGEIRNIPTEAILRVDILPEEVALKYGYTANQRVVNIVLRRRFHAITGELGGGGPTEGGQESGQAEGDLLHIRRDDRLNLDLKYAASSHLTEADRGLSALDALGAVPGDADTAGATGAAATGSGATGSGVVGTDADGASRYRTLLPATQSVTANGVLARTLPWGVSGTGNVTVGATTSESLQGLPTLDLTVPAGDPFSSSAGPVQVGRYVQGFGPLRQSVDGWTAHLGSTLNKDVGKWRLSLTDGYDHADSETRTDAGLDAAPLQALLDAGSSSFDPFAAPDPSLLSRLPQLRASSVSDGANIQFLGAGPLLRVPAGQLYASVKVGDTQSWLSSSSQRLGVSQAIGLSRNDVNAQLNLDLPLASRSHGVFGWAGEFSVNLNAALDQLSDFGLLHTLGYGMNWTPFDGVNLIVSKTQDQAAPTQAQLGGPAVLTPGFRLLDFTTGRTVDVTQVSGGNPALIADHRDVFKVGLTLKPISSQDLTIQANYIESRIKNPIASFPAATAQIEAAFPDRFTRDADGDLDEVDDRPVNFAEQDRSELRWGFNYSRPIGPQPVRRFPAGGRRWREGGGGRERGGLEPEGAPPPDGAPPPEGGPAPEGGSATAGSGGAQASAAGAGASSGAGGEGRGGSGGGYGGGGPDGGGGGGPGGGGPGGGGPGGGFGGGFGGGRRGRGGFGPPGGGRLQFAVYHTVFFDDRILIRPGVPELDLLNGAPVGSAGGQPRHEIEAQLGFTLHGLGARLSADWKSGTYVQGVAGSATGDLSFSDLATVNLRLFDNAGQQRSVVQRFPVARGVRITFAVANLFDQRLTVRDAFGVTPLTYQPGYLDPAGRTVRLSIRKLWF